MAYYTDTPDAEQPVQTVDDATISDTAAAATLAQDQPVEPSDKPETGKHTVEASNAPAQQQTITAADETMEHVSLDDTTVMPVEHQAPTVSIAEVATTQPAEAPVVVQAAEPAVQPVITPSVPAPAPKTDPAPAKASSGGWGWGSMWAAVTSTAASLGEFAHNRFFRTL